MNWRVELQTNAEAKKVLAIAKEQERINQEKTK
jgi:hypothetical protein